MMGMFFVQQGTIMARDITLPGGQTFELPSASMSLFNTASIIALIPVYDKILEPWMKRKGIRMSLLSRIGRLRHTVLGSDTCQGRVLPVLSI